MSNEIQDSDMATMLQWHIECWREQQQEFEVEAAQLNTWVKALDLKICYAQKLLAYEIEMPTFEGGLPVPAELQNTTASREYTGEFVPGGKSIDWDRLTTFCLNKLTQESIKRLAPRHYAGEFVPGKKTRIISHPATPPRGEVRRVVILDDAAHHQKPPREYTGEFLPKKPNYKQRAAAARKRFAPRATQDPRPQKEKKADAAPIDSERQLIARIEAAVGTPAAIPEDYTVSAHQMVQMIEMVVQHGLAYVCQQYVPAGRTEKLMKSYEPQIHAFNKLKRGDEIRIFKQVLLVRLSNWGSK